MTIRSYLKWKSTYLNSNEHNEETERLIQKADSALELMILGGAITIIAIAEIVVMILIALS